MFLLRYWIIDKTVLFACLLQFKRWLWSFSCACCWLSWGLLLTLRRTQVSTYVRKVQQTIEGKAVLESGFGWLLCKRNRMWCSCLHFAIFHVNDRLTFADLPTCDQPHGVCVYHLDPCPADKPYECDDQYHCPVETNKCCCRQPPPGKYRVANAIGCDAHVFTSQYFMLTTD